MSRRLWLIIAILLLSSLMVALYRGERVGAIMRHISSTNRILSRTDVEEIVRDYLLQHPELFEQIAAKHRQQKAMEEAARIKKLEHAVDQNRKQIFAENPYGSIKLGNHSGKFRLLIFTQHPCASCHKVEAILPEIMKLYPDLEIELRFWPFLGEGAIYPAKAVIAAQTQHAEQLLNNAFFTETDAINETKLKTILKRFPIIDEAALLKAMKNPKIDRALAANSNLAKTLLLDGTPFFLVANRDLSRISIILEYNQQFMQNIAIAINNIKSTLS